MSIYWAQRHQCATCEFWTGERRTHSDNRVVEADDFTTGICMGGNRYNRGKQMRPGTQSGAKCWVCSRYLKER